jgi:hypothetical protein
MVNIVGAAELSYYFFSYIATNIFAIIRFILFLLFLYLAKETKTCFGIGVRSGVIGETNDKWSLLFRFDLLAKNTTKAKKGLIRLGPPNIKEHIHLLLVHDGRLIHIDSTIFLILSVVRCHIVKKYKSGLF